MSQAMLHPVRDITDKDGKVTGHYQLATHKNGKVDTLTVVKVVKDHEGNEQVLYKTFSESAIAKKVMEEAAGELKVKEKMSTVKMGDEYKAKNGTTTTYGISDLIEFQGAGFLLVFFILAGLWGVLTAVSKILNLLGLTKPAPVGAAPRGCPSGAGATIHPGMKDETFAAIVGAVAAKTTIHPGLSDEAFLAIVTAAASQYMGGKDVSVVKFKPLNTMDWTWAVQGRVALHTNKV